MVKKRILLCADVRGWGGWIRGKYIQTHLSDEFQIDLVDMNEFGGYEKNTNKNILTPQELNIFRNEYSSDKEVIDLKELNKFIKKRRKGKNYDLIYFLFHTMLSAKKVKRVINTGIKTITIVTGLPTVKPIFGSKEHFLNLASKCCAIGANNNISLKDLQSIYKGKTFYASRGVDEKIFYPLSDKPKPKNEDFVVAYVGKPVPEKGLPIIKEACNRARVKLITNTRNFTNALSRDEMREFYNRADAYIVASTIDGTPNPMLEAAACGKPVIANHIGNAPEFIEHGNNGFLIRKEHDRSINKYAYWLKHLDTKRDLCFEIGMNARKSILDGWTWAKVTENERKIFREVLNEK